MIGFWETVAILIVTIIWILSVRVAYTLGQRDEGRYFLRELRRDIPDEDDGTTDDQS